jgi:hypothetical protein
MRKKRKRKKGKRTETRAYPLLGLLTTPITNVSSQHPVLAGQVLKVVSHVVLCFFSDKIDNFFTWLRAPPTAYLSRIYTPKNYHNTIAICLIRSFFHASFLAMYSLYS